MKLPGKQYVVSARVCRNGRTDKDYLFYTIGIPPELGRLLVGRYFIPELTDDGILFRPVRKKKYDTPSWLKTGGDGQ
jgi:hypothetical protein